MLPDLDSLRCFEAAASLLSFRAAASRVALSPPAFTDRIRRLEHDLGSPLFKRNSRRVQLTPAGQRLLPQARRVLEEAARCRLAASGGLGTEPFVLRIGTRFELGLSWLVPALPGLEKSRPERTLNLSFGAGPDLLQMLDQGRIDAVVTSARLNVAGVSYALLHEEHYALVATPRLLRRLPLKQPADAAQHVLLDIAADLPLFRYFLDAAPRGQAWDFKSVQLLGTMGAIRLRALQDAGIAVLPRYAIEKELAAKRLVPVLPAVKPRTDWFRLVWKSDHPRDAELRGLAEELAKVPLA